jgi:hypothetical protein
MYLAMNINATENILVCVDYFVNIALRQIFFNTVKNGIKRPKDIKEKSLKRLVL